VANERLASEASEWEREAREAAEQHRLLIASVAEERVARAAEAGALRQEAARLQATLTDSEEHVRPPTAPLRLPGRWTRWTRRMHHAPPHAQVAALTADLAALAAREHSGDNPAEELTKAAAKARAPRPAPAAPRRSQAGPARA
jgi:hypothetical protein